MAPKVLWEVGVEYLLPPVSEKDIKDGEWIRVDYNWVHIPSGNRGVKFLYVGDVNDIYVLLNHWNRDNDWKYFA